MKMVYVEYGWMDRANGCKIIQDCVYFSSGLYNTVGLILVLLQYIIFVEDSCIDQSVIVLQGGGVYGRGGGPGDRVNLKYVYEGQSKHFIRIKV